MIESPGATSRTAGRARNAAPRPPSRVPRLSGRRPGGGGSRTGPVVAAFSLAALLIGCGKTDEAIYPWTNLGGHVYVDRVPLENGMIAFGSMDPKVGQIVVTKVSRGRYIAEKVPLGPVRVYISSFKQVGPGGARVSLIPPKYQVGIALEVTRKSSEVDFKLDSTEPPAEPAADADTAGDETAPSADPAPDGTKSEPVPGPDPVPPEPDPVSPGPDPVSPGPDPVPDVNWG